MQIIEFLIKTEAPVAFAERSNDNILYATKNYIPGSAVRGALANKYIKSFKLETPHNDENFYNLFLSGKVRFLPAYPVISENLTENEVLVMPLSVMRSKDGKKYIDLSGESNVMPGFKKLTGFLQKADSKYYMPESELKIEMHMSRNAEIERIKGSSSDGKIFNYEYIEAEQLFKGSFIADEDIAGKFADMLQKINSSVVYLGRSKNAQYGKCAFRVLDKKHQNANISVKTGSLYLLLLTPYIPYGQFQRIDAAAEELIGDINLLLKQNNIRGCLHNKNLKLFAAAENIDGYVNVWHTKKTRETAVSAGSLIELKFNGSSEELNKLNTLFYKGFGKNTVEGFGQLRLWQPDNSITISEYNVNNEKPVINRPVKEKALQILHEVVMREVRRQAAADAYSKSFRMLGSGKNILKRVEGLVRSGYGKKEIQAYIEENFKKTAKDNLKKLYFNDDTLYEILTGKDGVHQPYETLYSKKMFENIPAELIEEFGADNIWPDENSIFKEYWLWFMRHAAKKSPER